MRRIGVRLGNWLTVEQGKRLLGNVEKESLRGIRNYAIVAMLIGCGLRRASCFLYVSIRFNHVKSAGSLPTCRERPATSEPSRYLHG